jgi:pyridoxal phosphate enzyme (YggS family)
MTTGYSERLVETLPRVRERIARAELDADRAAGAVRLIAVTKSHPFAAVRAALDAGLRDLGENRVEELAAKVAEFGRDAATWHMIGHIQGRKTAKAAELSDLIHSIDSAKLAERVARRASEMDVESRVLLQVNTSGEASKSGLAVESAVEDVVRLADSPGLRVDGLMTMAPFVDDERVLGNAFRRLREISEAAAGHSDNVGPELSMGMTNDLHIAIREGSTMVRIGTALFGPR